MSEGTDVNRYEIEIKLNRDRAWMIEKLMAMSEEELHAPRTFSEHDPTKTWSYADHFIHTTLIERHFNAMFRRHLAGEAAMDPAGPRFDGSMKVEDIMKTVHAFTEEWAEEHRGKPFDELVRIGLAVRADTLKLLSELSDEQLASKIPGAPWADGTVGAIMAVNADHGRAHYHYAKEGTAGAA